MAYKHSMEPKGSILLKILIGFLIIFLVVSVLYPKKLWDDQEKLITDSRERMDNLNQVSQRFQKVNGTYIADLDSLVKFIETDSIMVKRETFDFEQLSLYDAPYDSFLVGFNDLFHFDHIEVEPFSNGAPAPETLPEGEVVDSVVMKMIPKQLYTDVIEPVVVSMTSPKGVKYQFRDKGVDDIYWLIWSPGKMERTYAPYEEKMVPSKDYILFRDLADITTDPITGKPFVIFKNKKITLEGKISYNLVRNGEPDPAVFGSELYTNLFIHQLGRKARSSVEQLLQQDTTLFDQQLQLQTDYFDTEIELLSPRRSVDVEASKERMIPADSVDQYNNVDRIRAALFSVTYDSLIRVWTNSEMTQEKLKQLTYEEELSLAKETTVGVTIRAPFEKEYDLPGGGILSAIFSVGPIDHPGYIENNDLSWEEKR
ncbi:hypothetical protein KQI63_14820 [bacterium]|nr:hypothetical protein [bacterium]